MASFGAPWLVAPALLAQLPLLRFRLLQPKPHVHLAVHRRRGGKVLLRLLALARAPVELAEAEVAVGDERAHAARPGEGQRLAVVGLAARGIEPVGMGRDVSQQVESVGRVPEVTRSGFDCAVGQVPRIVELTEPETGATKRVVGPAAMAHDSPSPRPLEEPLALPDPGQRLARRAALRQCPGGGGDRTGKLDVEVTGPGHLDSALGR